MIFLHDKACQLKTSSFPTVKGRYLLDNAQQKGAVLVVSLIILLVLTLIAISVLQSSVVEQKISFHYQDANIALQSVDAAQRQVENLIDGLADTSGFINQNGLYESGQTPDPYLASTWTGTVSSVLTLPNFGADPPRYFIERVQTLENGAMSLNIYNYGQNPQPGSVTLFRIVTYSTGRSGDAQTIAQSFYARTF